MKQLVLGDLKIQDRRSRGVDVLRRKDGKLLAFFNDIGADTFGMWLMDRAKVKVKRK